MRVLTKVCYNVPATRRLRTPRLRRFPIVSSPIRTEVPALILLAIDVYKCSDRAICRHANPDGLRAGLALCHTRHPNDLDRAARLVTDFNLVSADLHSFYVCLVVDVERRVEI